MAKTNPALNGGAHNNELMAVHDSMLSGLGQLSDYFGFSKVMGQLYGALLLSAKPLSLDDLMERLSISKASVSTNIRTLENMGMVRQVWMREHSGRRKYYEAETDLWQIISNVISGREMRDVERALNVIQDNADKLRTSMPEMSATEREVAELYIERMAQMQGMFRFAQLIMTSILARVGEIDPEGISRVDIE